MSHRPPLVVTAVLAGAVWAFGCGPPTQTRTRPLLTRLDSALDSVGRIKDPRWRAAHYPAANLHGPFSRPPLGDTAADTNDPVAYYRLADSVRQMLPGLADRAYYWALRLDPTFADAYFARWTLLRRDFPYRQMPDSSIRPIFKVQPAAAGTTDSLLALAIGYSPFLDGTVDVPRWIVNMDARRAGRDPVVAGMRHYALGDYRAATVDWATALKKDPKAMMLHIPRAYAWVKLDEADSAIADLEALAQRIETAQRDSLLAPYFSKEFLYYAIGMLHAGRQRMPEARAAYEHALAENLGFYMAHLRLAATAAALDDTTAALTEAQTALLIRPDDPLVLIYNGNLLLRMGHVADAEQQFRAALRLDSDYAMAHAFMGMAAEARHDTAVAKAEYQDYLTRAPRHAVERGWVAAQLAKLAKR